MATYLLGLPTLLPFLALDLGNSKTENKHTDVRTKFSKKMLFIKCLVKYIHGIPATMPIRIVICIR